ncbi:MAG TPA: hypothetical protein VHG30_17845 [Microvirga sp.]|nr:hypothetical protein [Microvirga sp.]
MRLYFHLKDTHEVIRDAEGIEVADLEDARAQVIQATKELRRENASAARDWSGWTLSVADERGMVVFALDLDACSRLREAHASHASRAGGP